MKRKSTSQTLGIWLAEWFSVYKLPTVAKSTAENIERVIRLHIPQWLKDLRLTDLRAFTIDKALSGIKSTRMRKYAFHVLNNSLNKAFRLDLIESDIMKKAEPIKHRSKRGEALTVTEQREFLQKVGNHYMRNLFEFYLYTGVRRCEALSLRWADIDFESDSILIRGTKTLTSFRRLDMLPRVREILLKQKAQCPDSPLVFPYKKFYVDEVFKKFCPNHKLHDLRHTFVTRCAECGINVNVCQSLAGHSDIKVTLQTYTHATDFFRKSEYMKFDIEPPK
ncbi:MAG TPA: site-specific integrase [Candidatus Borkfalkia avistercoris]|uniref:Site-specific integrase n=1 Tax=Candidatus Borkfalkia avistercoris TaxID=2838504 RepID=A0A9D2D071_9FIRM|nr:site-specific integrase [Candidatus Borkfalkia avistercoris]